MSSATDARPGRGPAPPAGVNYLELAFGLMGGPAVWLLRLIVNSSLVEYSCRISATWPIWVTTLVATVISVIALVVAWRYDRMTGDGMAEAAHWLGRLGLMFNVLAIIGIVFETLPALFLDVCRSVTPWG